MSNDYVRPTYLGAAFGRITIYTNVKFMFNTSSLL